MSLNRSKKHISFLPEDWPEHPEDYVIMRHERRFPVEPDVDMATKEQQIAEWKQMRWDYDPESGRVRPFQKHIAPCTIINVPHQTKIYVAKGRNYEEDYTAYLRVICRMLAYGIEVKDWMQLPVILRYHIAQMSFLNAPRPLPPPSPKPAWRDWSLCKRASQSLSIPPRDLFEAAERGDTNAACSFLETGTSVDSQNARGMTPLQLAARGGHRDTVQVLLEYGADVNVQTKTCWTVLMSAAMSGDVDLCVLLIEHGTPLNTVTVLGQTALVAAAIYGHGPCLRLLLENGADVHTLTDPLHYTLLMLAAGNCDIATVQLLLECGLDVNEMGIDFMTPLRCARHGARTDIMAFLKQAGARE